MGLADWDAENPAEVQRAAQRVWDMLLATRANGGECYGDPDIETDGDNTP